MTKGSVAAGFLDCLPFCHYDLGEVSESALG